MPKQSAAAAEGFVRELGPWDSTMIVAGSMIGSGIFIVPADIARNVGSAGWLLAVWVVTGLLTVAAALSYGELGAMMPRAGGQYVYLREAYSPLWGFLYGWTLFLVIQTGTIAAVAVGFARFLGVLVPAISPTAWIVPPIDLSDGYAISLSWQQLVGVLLIVLLSLTNTRGIKLGKLIQNTFTAAKTLSLVALVLLGILVGRNHAAIAANFADLWTPRGVSPIVPDLPFVPPLAATAGAFALLVAVCVSQVGSLFSADAWNNITFASAEIKNPRRTLPLALAAGTTLVIGLYVLANVSYLVTLPLAAIQHAPDDRVATAALEAIFGPVGATMMAIAIIVSTFGCNNGLILAGARVYYAMAKDRLFFAKLAKTNRFHVPALALIAQGIWAAVLVLPRTVTYNPQSTAPVFGNVYTQLLEYIVSVELVFGALSVLAVIVLRYRKPGAERPYRAWGYPVVPVIFIVLSLLLVVNLAFLAPATSGIGYLIVLTGIPIYFIWRKKTQ
jgi:APA family basic amino acid/polyamine antiporter